MPRHIRLDLAGALAGPAAAAAEARAEAEKEQGKREASRSMWSRHLPELRELKYRGRRATSATRDSTCNAFAALEVGPGTLQQVLGGP